MKSLSLPEEFCPIRAIAERLPGLELLVLFGSRARGDAAFESDWDFAYLESGFLDVNRLRAELSLKLSTDRVDLADLSRSNGLLRYRVATEGMPIFESREGIFLTFCYEAVSLWCDAQPVLAMSDDTVLARLDQ